MWLPISFAVIGAILGGASLDEEGVLLGLLTGAALGVAVQAFRRSSGHGHRIEELERQLSHMQKALWQREQEMRADFGSAVKDTTSSADEKTDAGEEIKVTIDGPATAAKVVASGERPAEQTH